MKIGEVFEIIGLDTDDHLPAVVLSKLDDVLRLFL